MTRQPQRGLRPESAYASLIPATSPLTTTIVTAAGPRISTSRKHRTASHQSISPIKYTTLIALIVVFITLLSQQTFVALKNTYHYVKDSRMTYIPPDTKAPVPDHNPPPYAPTDPSVSSKEADVPPYVAAEHSTPHAGFPSAEEEKARLKSQEQAQPYRDNGESSRPKIPQSEAISSSSSVSIVGPLEIVGSVSSSGSVSLREGIKVHGKISSSATVKISENVEVAGKISASGSIKLRDNVRAEGKLEASGNVELRNQVTVVGKVDSSGSVKLEQDVDVKAKVDCSGTLLMKDGAVVHGDVNASGEIRIEGARECVVGGKVEGNADCIVDGHAVVAKDLKISGSLTVNGRLHVKGDLGVRGSVTIESGGECIVDGEKKIRGSLHGTIGASKS